MVLSLATFALRCTLWSFAPGPWVVAGPSLFLGLTYGAALVASVDYADRNAPTGMEATSQSLVSGLVSGLGRSLGGMVAGPLYDGIGPRSTFGLFAAWSALAAVVFHRFWRRPRRRT